VPTIAGHAAPGEFGPELRPIGATQAVHALRQPVLVEGRCGIGKELLGFARAEKL
jgi:hypothetical protein